MGHEKRKSTRKICMNEMTMSVFKHPKNKISLTVRWLHEEIVFGTFYQRANQNDRILS